eukprot:gene43798-26992_t
MVFQMHVKKAGAAVGFSAADLKQLPPRTSVSMADRETGSGMNRDRTDKHAVADTHDFNQFRAGLKKTGGPKLQNEQVSGGIKDRMAAFQ